MKTTLDNYVSSDEDVDRVFAKKCLDIYFEPKGFEKWKGGRVYEWLGIGYLQKTFDKYIIPSSVKGKNTTWTVGKPNKENLKKFKSASLINETVHSLAALPAVILIPPNLYEGNYLTTLGISLIALPSIALSLLQRYNRARVQNVLDKKYGEIK